MSLFLAVCLFAFAVGLFGWATGIDPIDGLWYGGITLGITLTLAFCVSLIVNDLGDWYVAEETEIASVIEFNNGKFYYDSPEVDGGGAVMADDVFLFEGEGRLLERKKGYDTPWLFDTRNKEHILYVEEVEWK